MVFALEHLHWFKTSYEFFIIITLIFLYNLVRSLNLNFKTKYESIKTKEVLNEVVI